jgi:uncharacterized phage protein (TIGR02220 family)
MELMLFIKDLRNKGALYYKTWMPILIQYNGENGQVIKLSVTPDVAKSTYYRIIQYGVDVFPKYIKNYSLVKKRNQIIIMLHGKAEQEIVPEVVVKPKHIKPREPQVKPIDKIIIFQEIIDYLNLCTGNKYKPNSKIAIQNITSRLKEGYVFDDFKKVIDIKSINWIGTEYEQHLNPKTLFGDKFEIYVNEKTSIKKSKQENAYEQVIKATELGFNS